MQTATFDPAGGPLSAEVSSGFAHPGAYTLLLWDGSRVVLEERGDLASGGGAHPLPEPASANHSRTAEAIVTVIVTPPIGDYHVALTITQDGRTLGAATASGTGASGSVTSDLFVALAAEGGA